MKKTLAVFERYTDRDIRNRWVNTIGHCAVRGIPCIAPKPSCAKRMGSINMRDRDSTFDAHFGRLRENQVREN